MLCFYNTICGFRTFIHRTRELHCYHSISPYVLEHFVNILLSMTPFKKWFWVFQTAVTY